MELLLYHPEAAGRSCDDCEKYVYDDTPEKLGRRSLHLSEPLLRCPGSRTPCHMCPKIPPDRPRRREFAVELSERSWRVYQHYLEAKAVGFTETEKADPIVRLHAGIIRGIEDRFFLGAPGHKLEFISQILLSLFKVR